MPHRLSLQRRFWEKMQLLSLLSLAIAKERTLTVLTAFGTSQTQGTSRGGLLLIYFEDNGIDLVQIDYRILRVL
jgi:hypothetical protein